ncbi:MAG: UDP-N-acetylglucosamine--N-acetylmuramyl-(pentapeptide) pyrophosphoryl-undecaprenol N-acetylglucosamine transferase, partial [Acidimicrobiales bacterium]
LSVADALVRRGHAASAIHFVGSRRGQERTLVPAAGFAVTLLPGRGVARRVNLESAGAVAGLGAALLGALVLLARLRPAVVVSVGGYAALPTALAAVLLRMPLVLTNPDAVPNTANRLVGRFAAASAVAFEGTPLPRATVTGSPVRPEVEKADRSPEGRGAARRILGLPEGRTTVAVFTGSLGSRRVNEAVAGLVADWAGNAGLTLRHVVGRRDWPELCSRLPVPPDDGLCYRPVEYEDRMPALLASADVLIGRAGASTVAEVAAVGLPAILVPLPGAPGDHQTANAAVLARAGGAVVLADQDCTSARLEAMLGNLLGDAGRLETMGKAAAGIGRPGAAAAVAALVEQCARRG